MMENSQSDVPKKVVRLMEPSVELKTEEIKTKYRRMRVVAYCRVSTKEEEQLNSYENQLKHYTEAINANPDWEFVGIFADKGISGTSVKNRDEFNKMIRLCKRGKVDMIMVKAISRFARNTVDCLKYTRLLKDIGVDVFFEEQKLHSTQPGAELYITIYGCLAQSESENLSANVIWGKLQSAKEGKVHFNYKAMLGYKKGADGNPEIVEDEAEIVRFIYNEFLRGESMGAIAKKLNDRNVKTALGSSWHQSIIKSILSNEKYKGDAIINKTFVVNYLTKKVKKNNGERPKYYVENSHPAIIDESTFARVQQEIARRSGQQQAERAGNKTVQVKYSSKYALTQLLICGECKSPYRRVIWMRNGEKVPVWRCDSRLKDKKKYCRRSPSIKETVLHDAIMSAVSQLAQSNTQVLTVLKKHIGQVIGEEIQDESAEIQIRLAEIDIEFKEMINAITADMVDTFDKNKVEQLMAEKEQLRAKLNFIEEKKRNHEMEQSRLQDIYDIVDGLKNRHLTYDDNLIRSLVNCVIVESPQTIKVVFNGGTEIIEKIEK
jgi:DNA invertase Pin-like site-specific DNA recombinase